MRLECVKSFIAVINARSFSRAAKTLFISQPTISTHIKQLEEELGVQLLVRSTKDVLPSEEGRIFYPYALQLVETEDEALKCLRRESGGKKRVVPIAITSGYSYCFLPRFLSAAREKAGDISFRIMEGDNDFVMGKMRDYEADISISDIPGKGKQLNSNLLFEDEIILITPNESRYRGMKGIFPVDQIKNERFVMQESALEMRWITDAVAKVFNQKTISSNVTVTVESVEMVLRAVEGGSGVAFMSAVTAEEAVRAGRVLRFSFSDLPLRHKVFVTYRVDKSAGKPVGQIVELINRVFHVQ